MPLSSTNVKADPVKLELAKLKGINKSKIFRDALDISLRVKGDDMEMLEAQLTEIRKQMEILTLEETLILNQIKSLESGNTLNQYREDKFAQWKINLAFQIGNNTIDWEVLRRIFKFKNVPECKKWLLSKLKEDNLI